MDILFKADIFFFISTMAIAIVVIAIVIALFFLIQILRDVRYTTKRIRDGADNIISDVDDLREFVKREGKRAVDIKEVIDGVLGIFRKKKRPQKKKELAKESSK